MKAHTEEAFEVLIEEHLLNHGGYEPGNAADFDAELGVIKESLLGYIEDTQPKVWAKQLKIHGDKLGATLLKDFDKATTQFGVLHVLRHGFKFYGKLIRVASFKPAHGLNPDVQAQYDANRLQVVRQVNFDPKKPALSLDLVLCLNGIPVVTVELKNAMTGQSANHAKRQYREDRDPDAPIFKFKRRSLVHFAVGSDEAWMTTQLRKTKTFFLPFNRGHGTAKGNPPVQGKHRTHYLWEAVWPRDSLLDIIHRYMHLEEKEIERPDGSTYVKETMIFPRFHQLDCVRKLVAAVGESGAGRNYLVQHSAGSGKSNSIAWLAHRLSSLHDATDQKIFHSVVVITDRLVLDQQLQNTIFQFDHKDGVVEKIDENSTQLAEALEGGVSIIISTIHKFGFVADKIGDLPHRRYAIIVDEAHGSQSGEMARNMKAVLGASSIAAKFEEEADDVATPDQAALRAALSRGSQDNLSFFAFTATPKHKTLELFGHTGPDGKPAPFHLYSMRQAIEEKFILDVLRGYTTYKRYFKLVKSVADDPSLDKKRASRALARFVSLHPVNIAQKTEVIVEHYRSCVMNKLGGQAKAMVVTSSRLHAVRYKREMDAYLAEKNYTDVRTLVAFSGDVVDPADPTTKDKPYTEPEMNKHTKTGKPLKAKELPKAFGGPDYNVLIVANKFQTGFDQPLLSAMYVDKRLSGIQAVQTLSRLNRTSPGKTETFVLDFQNERDEILESFQDYFEGTTVTESVDPQRLYQLQGELDAAQIYTLSELDRFAAIFFKPQAKQNHRDNAGLTSALDPAFDRFKACGEDERQEFRDKLVAFCSLYAFMAQIVPFHDVDLEKRYVFGKMLLNRIALVGDKPPKVVLGDDVALYYYRLQKEADGDLKLSADGAQELDGPMASGTGKSENEKEQLSKLIEVVNDRFGTDFDAQDLIDGVTDQLVSDQKIQAAAAANDRANFEYVGTPAFDGALIDRHAKHGTFIDRVFSDDEILSFLRKKVLDDVYNRLTQGGV